MALIVEDGSGKVDADSYLSVANSNTYWDKHGYASAWRDALEEKKEEALRMATQWIDLTFGGRWDGERREEAQALDWPRSGIEDADGFDVAEDSLPQALKDATAEAAQRYLADAASLMPDLKPADAGIGSESVTFGPISESVTFIGSKPSTTVFRKINAMLRDFVFSANTLERA